MMFRQLETDNLKLSEKTGLEVIGPVDDEGPACSWVHHTTDIPKALEKKVLQIRAATVVRKSLFDFQGPLGANHPQSSV